MGRPATGQVPVKDRLAAYKERLIESGGRRVIVDLDAQANEALQTIIERDGLTDHRARVQTAVRSALIAFARPTKPR